MHIHGPLHTTTPIITDIRDSFRTIEEQPVTDGEIPMQAVVTIMYGSHAGLDIVLDKNSGIHPSIHRINVISSYANFN
ncbi:hypothetical protein V3C99_016853 [Haemonchus contortus]